MSLCIAPEHSLLHIITRSTAGEGLLPVSIYISVCALSKALSQAPPFSVPLSPEGMRRAPAGYTV